MIVLSRAKIIAVLGTSPSRALAARGLGFANTSNLNRRLRAERITVRRISPRGAPSFLVIEDRRPSQAKRGSAA